MWVFNDPPVSSPLIIPESEKQYLSLRVFPTPAESIRWLVFIQTKKIDVHYADCAHTLLGGVCELI